MTRLQRFAGCRKPATPTRPTERCCSRWRTRNSERATSMVRARRLPVACNSIPKTSRSSSFPVARTNRPCSSLRIGGVSQSVAEEIEPENQEGDGEPREQRQVGRIEEMRSAPAEHRAPAGRGRLYTQAEKAQRRFADHRARHAERSLNDHGGNRRGHDVTK